MTPYSKLIWIGDSLKNLKKFPGEVQDSIGYILQKVQEGFLSRSTKQLKGFKPAVMEIVSDFDTNTYRALYTDNIGDDICVLHCFQKKSKQEINLIKQRLKEAESINKITR